MIKRTDLLAITFYDRSPFTGSESGMRYRIEKSSPENDEPFFLITIWPEPFSFENTPDEKKASHREAFSEEGLLAAVDWLNEQSKSFPDK